MQRIHLIILFCPLQDLSCIHDALQKHFHILDEAQGWSTNPQKSSSFITGQPRLA